jgi:long-chain acyl-CoA synthetase
MSNLWDLAHIQPRHDLVVEGETMSRLFVNAATMRGDKTFLREKTLGIWRAWSWRESLTAVREIAMGLEAIGMEPGEVASIQANTTVEWVLADLGVLCAGGVCNGIYPTDAAVQTQFLCADSRTCVLFVEDDEQLDKALEVRSQLPLLRHIVVFDMDGLARFSDPMVMSLDALRAAGRAHDAAHPSAFEQRVASRQPRDLAILIYTSGTTGKPKGAMHSHAGIVYTARGYNTLIAQREGDERMCFLPLCHVAERLGGEYFAVYSGAILNFVENPDTVPENVREIAPTVMTAVPRVWEKFYSAVTMAVREAGRTHQLLYGWSLRAGQRVADLVLEGKPVPVGAKLQFTLARWLALDNVRKAIGIHRARYLVTGAAPIAPDLVRWYLALGLPMLEVWGQTESCGASTGMPVSHIKPGSIGPACGYNEVKVDAASGELLIRGPNVFMGYLNLPEKTAETIDADGWLHTGDVGTVDADGYFRITDRMKELKFSPYITDAVVIGDRRAYLSAIVMVDQENVERYAQDHDVPFSNYASLTRAPAIVELIQGEVDRVNKKFARVEQVKAFRLLETQLTAEDEELTPTMKLKRSLVQKKYADLIESMYRGSP